MLGRLFSLHFDLFKNHFVTWWTWGEGRRRGCDVWREQRGTCTPTCEIDSWQGTCYMAQEHTCMASVTIQKVGREGRWEGGSGRGDMWCNYGWFLLIFDWKRQNSVKPIILQLKQSGGKGNHFVELTWSFWRNKEQKQGAYSTPQSMA